MRIVLINPRIVTTPTYPLGLMYIASVLEKEGHTVSIIDSIEPPEDIAKKSLSFSPDIVGITVVTPQYPKSIKVADGIKAADPRVIVVVGGVHATAAPREVLSNRSVDYVVVGEGEITFKELSSHLSMKGRKAASGILGIGYKEGRRMRFTKPRPLIEDLDTLPFPAYHLLDSDIYYKPPKMRGTWSDMTGYIMASRGCPYYCIYCSSHLIFGRRVRRRSVGNVMGEIRFLRRWKKITAVYFFDDTFTTDPEWVKDFCRSLMREGWKDFSWGCQARVNTLMDLEMLRLMKQSNCCQIDIGVESGSQRNLNTLKKGITEEQIYKAFSLLKEVGLKTFASWIIGIPGETEEDIMKTVQVLERVKPDYCDFNFLTPYPGTECSAMAERLGIGHGDYESYMPSKLADRPAVCFYSTPENLIRYRTLLYSKVVMRNYMTMIRNPKMLRGMAEIFMKGIGGLGRSFPRYLRTKNIDDIVQGVIGEYRRKEMRRAGRNMVLESEAAQRPRAAD